MAKRRNYAIDPTSLQNRNQKLLREREVLRDEIRALVDEREVKDRELVRLQGEITDITRLIRAATFVAAPEPGFVTALGLVTWYMKKNTEMYVRLREERNEARQRWYHRILHRTSAWCDRFLTMCHIGPTP
jgi:hypothetical protein